MATITKRGDTYKITVSMGYDINGRQLRQHTTWTPSPKMTPRQIDKELERQKVLFEEQCQTQQVYGGGINLADFAEKWFTDYAEKHLKPRTIANYRFFLKRIVEALGHIRLDKLQPKHLLTFYANLDEEGIRADTKYAALVDFKKLLKERNITQTVLSKSAGVSMGVVESMVANKHITAASAKKVSAALEKPLAKLFTPATKSTLSGKTKLHYHRFLSTMLETAVQWQIIPNNPCNRVKPPHAEQTETAYLDEVQAAKLITVLNGEPLQYRTMILLLLNTGLRRGELCGLEWPDIDTKNAVLSIRRNSLYLPGKGVYTDTPKTKSSVRSIKLPSNCIPMLTQYRAWQTEQRLKLGDQWQDCNRLFTTWNGSPMHPDSLTNWFSDFVKRHDLPHITIHGLRHTNATLLIAAGTNLRTVSGRLGHAQASTTANIYAHAIQSADAIAAETLDNILSVPQRKAQ